MPLWLLHFFAGVGIFAIGAVALLAWCIVRAPSTQGEPTPRSPEAIQIELLEEIQRQVVGIHRMVMLDRNRS